MADIKTTLFPDNEIKLHAYLSDDEYNTIEIHHLGKHVTFRRGEWDDIKEHVDLMFFQLVQLSNLRRVM